MGTTANKSNETTMNYQLTPLIKSPTGDYHIAKDDTVRCWVCSGSGDVKDKKTGEMRVCRACMGKGRVKV
jgi:DnaJ-class molecular chaperone